MPSISDMPAEIVIKISHSLTTQELGNLRLASKRTEAATFKPFAREFFHKKQFMLTEPSLQALIDISEHPQFGPELSHLVVGLDCYPDEYPYQAQGTDEQRHELITGQASQRALLANGVAFRMLVHAFRRLPGLDTVGIRAFNSRSRTRDRGTWHSYGSETVRQATNIYMIMASGHRLPYVYRDGNGHYLDSSIAFSLVTQALAEAQRAAIGIECIIRARTGGLTDKAFVVHDFDLPRTVTLVSTMRKLHLDLLMGNNLNPVLSMEHPQGRDKGVWLRTSHLQTFLSHASSLEWLRLNFRGNEDVRTSLLLGWIALPTSVPAPLHFNAPLKQLDLGQTCMPRSMYWNVIRRFKDTLEGLSLWNVTIEITKDHFEDKVDEWTHLFKQIATLPRLKDINLGRLRLKPNYTSANSGAFLGIGPAGDRREDKYRGDSAGDYLRQLAAHARVNWTELEPQNTQAGMDDDDDDDDEVIGDDEDEDSDDAFVPDGNAADGDAMDEDGDNV